MVNYPLVCICIPHYNNEKTISRTLDSLIAQTYKNIIIKIFDNASTDNSLKILQEYEKKYENIQLFVNEKNIGGEKNFTKCFENAEGKFTTVFHADDVYDSKIIEEQVSFLKKQPDCVAVSTHALFIDDKDKPIGEHFLPPEISELSYAIFDFASLFKYSLKYGNFITCPSVMIRTKIIQEKIKFWNFKNFKTSADFDVWLRLSEEGKFGFINKPLIKYRISEVSYSYNNNRVATELFDMFLVFEKYLSRENVKHYLTNEDYQNYLMQYNNAVLSININRFLKNNQNKYLTYKKEMCICNKKYFKYLFIKLIFSLVKYIDISPKIKSRILAYKTKI